MRTATQQRKYQKYQRVILGAAEHVAASELRIAFGGDCGMFPHRDDRREFPAMVANGITLERALKAATSTAADRLGLTHLGVVAEGGTADLVATPGNSFNDIAVTGGVDLVVKAGRIHRRPDAADAAHR